MANNPSNECGEHNAGAEHALSPTQEKNHRQSDRVYLTLPIRVSGIRGHGKDFLEEGQTIDISRQGATIKVDRDLFAGEIVKIQRLDGVGKEATARVVGRVAGGSEGYEFGVTMLDPAIVNPLGVVFPTVASMHKAVLRALLRCVVCGRNEVVVVRELARGGLSFYSATKYPEGSRVEIAVPYSSKAPNIYSPARIVSSRNGAGKDLLEYEYGVAYLE